jgi:2-isopropylmalate synthase
MEHRVFVFDTTLADGERTPGCSMTLEEKLRMARQLERLRVDAIEAGTPMASPGDFEAVRLIAKNIETCTVVARSRCSKADVDRAWESIQSAKRPRIHLVTTTSLSSLPAKPVASHNKMVEEAVWAVTYAKSFCNDVQFTCEDATRSDPDVLRQVVDAVVNAGATVVSLPDTFGYATPEEYGAMFNTVRQRVRDFEGVVLSAHCHNDLGLAVANSLAALQNGARQVECTVNGIGERAGTASLEELVMLLQARKEHLLFTTNVNAEEIYKSSRLLSSLTGMLVQRNKPIVGTNAFLQHPVTDHTGTPKYGLAYALITPQAIGIKHSTLVLGKHSDRNALKRRYSELGYDVSPDELERIFYLFRQVVEHKKEIVDEDLVAILEDRDEDSDEVYHLENIQVHSGTTLLPTATVELRKGDQRFVDSATGDGPVDAAYKAIERVTGLAGQLTEYLIKSVSLGRDAFGEVFVTVDFNGVLYNGRGVSTDVVAGSAKAYLEALNRALASQKRRGQERKGQTVPAPP